MIDQTKNAITRTVEQFQEYPYFLSERDLQAVLFAELRNATSDLRYPYDAEGANRGFGFNNPFSIHPVTTEYYPYRRRKDRFDVAVLSEIPDPTSAIWGQPCRIAIEIKLWQPGYREPSHLKDVEKLRQYQAYLQDKFLEKRQFTGIAMVFVHPCAEELLQTVISEKTSGDAYPGNGIALHFVTHTDHWWKQQFAAPTPEEVSSLAQTP